MEENGGSSLPMKENTAGLVAYLFGWVSGLVLYLLENKSTFVRFHALQSLILFGVLSVAGIILRWIPFIGGILSVILGIGTFAAWIVGMVKAYQGEMFKFPVVGDIAESQIRE